MYSMATSKTTTLGVLALFSAGAMADLLVLADCGVGTVPGFPGRPSFREAYWTPAAGVNQQNPICAVIPVASGDAPWGPDGLTFTFPTRDEWCVYVETGVAEPNYAGFAQGGNGNVLYCYATTDYPLGKSQSLPQSDCCSVFVCNATAPGQSSQPGPNQPLPAGQGSVVPNVLGSNVGPNSGSGPTGGLSNGYNPSPINGGPNAGNSNGLNGGQNSGPGNANPGPASGPIAGQGNPGSGLGGDNGGANPGTAAGSGGQTYGSASGGGTGSGSTSGSGSGGTGGAPSSGNSGAGNGFPAGSSPDPGYAGDGNGNNNAGVNTGAGVGSGSVGNTNSGAGYAGGVTGNIGNGNGHIGVGSNGPNSGAGSGVSLGYGNPSTRGSGDNSGNIGGNAGNGNTGSGVGPSGRQFGPIYTNAGEATSGSSNPNTGIDAGTGVGLPGNGVSSQVPYDLRVITHVNPRQAKLQGSWSNIKNQIRINGAGVCDSTPFQCFDGSTIVFNCAGSSLAGSGYNVLPLLVDALDRIANTKGWDSGATTALGPCVDLPLSLVITVKDEQTGTVYGNLGYNVIVPNVSRLNGPQCALCDPQSFDNAWAASIVNAFTPAAPYYNRIITESRCVPVQHCV